MDWLLHPAWQYGLEIAGLALCLHLFLSLKREVSRSGAQALLRQQASEEKQEAIQMAVEEIQNQLRRLEESAARLVEPPPAASGLNIHKRRQVVRMHHRGEAPGQIAAALSLPEREVELLLKIEKAALQDS